MLATLPFSLNFAHPLMEWSLLAVGGWALYLGIKAKKTRTGTPEQRKNLVPKKFAQRHYLWGSILLAVMTLGTLGEWLYVSEQWQVVRRAASAGWSGHDRHDCGCCVTFSVDATWQSDCPQGACGPEYGHADAVPLASR